MCARLLSLAATSPRDGLPLLRPRARARAAAWPAPRAATFGWPGASPTPAAAWMPPAPPIVYCGYIGGIARTIGADGVAVDAAGNCLRHRLPPPRPQPSFPATVGPDLTFNGGYDAFVAKVRADGTALVYLGYIGGDRRSERLEPGRRLRLRRSRSMPPGAPTSSADALEPAHVPGRGRARPHVQRAAGTPGRRSSPRCGRTARRSTTAATSAASTPRTASASPSTTRAPPMSRAGPVSSEATFPVATGPDLTFNGGSYDAFAAKVRAGRHGVRLRGLHRRDGVRRGRCDRRRRQPQRLRRRRHELPARRPSRSRSAPTSRSTTAERRQHRRLRRQGERAPAPGSTTPATSAGRPSTTPVRDRRRRLGQRLRDRGHQSRPRRRSRSSAGPDLTYNGDAGRATPSSPACTRAASCLDYCGYIGGSSRRVRSRHRGRRRRERPRRRAHAARARRRSRSSGGPDLTYNGGTTTPSSPRSARTGRASSSAATSAARPRITGPGSRSTRRGASTSPAGRARTEATLPGRSSAPTSPTTPAASTPSSPSSRPPSRARRPRPPSASSRRRSGGRASPTSTSRGRVDPAANGYNLWYVTLKTDIVNARQIDARRRPCRS